MSKRHKWIKGGDGWWQCEKCGLIKEKYFGMPYMYYMDMLNSTTVYGPKAPPCPPTDYLYPEKTDEYEKAR